MHTRKTNGKNSAKQANHSPSRAGNNRKTCALPAILKPLFWEYKFNALSWDKDSDLITEKVLAYGEWDTVAWLRCRLGDKNLREWLIRRRGAGLSPRQLRFWELILAIPHRLVNTWLAEEGRSIWDNRCHP